MEYTVIFLFNRDLSKVLLQLKDRHIHAGKLNGVGGKLMPGELPYSSALRELREETGVVLQYPELHHIADITMPIEWDHRCRPNKAELFFYAAKVDEDAPSQQPGETEELVWKDVDWVLSQPATYDGFAGDGDLQYIVNKAVNHFRALSSDG